jgi:hypothetical protein
MSSPASALSNASLPVRAKRVIPAQRSNEIAVGALAGVGAYRQPLRSPGRRPYSALPNSQQRGPMLLQNQQRAGGAGVGGVGGAGTLISQDIGVRIPAPTICGKRSYTCPM